VKRPIIIIAAAITVAIAACAGVLGLRTHGDRAFAHRAHVMKGVSCVTCHAGVQNAGDKDPLHLPDETSCLTCHEKPHDTRPCLECHSDPLAAPGAVDARAHLRFEHSRHQAATSGNCMRCHQGVAEGDTHLRPPMAACWSCHEHDRARDVRACDNCHEDLAEEGTPPASHLVHEGDFVHGHGKVAAASADLCGTCHAERFCATCHGVSAPPVSVKSALGDPLRPLVHRAGFRSRHSIEAKADPGACMTCHQPERCQSCHIAEGVGAIGGSSSANPHPPGWVGLTSGENEHGRAARRDPSACASCHGGAGESLCVGCHREGGVGGNPHPPGWSSRLALTDMPCRLCHTGGGLP
jgi:hypothetical protein